jgi:thiamine transport system substrate-binding protein
MGGKKYFPGGFGALMAILGMILAAVPLFGGGGKDTASDGGAKEAVIWTYDSFNSEWGPGPAISQTFEEETGIRILWVVHGDAGTLLSRLLLEGKDASADIVLGLDQNLAGRALASGLFEPYKPAGAERVFSELVIDETWRLIPWDYSYFAINYDSEKLSVPPASLEDLTKPEYAGKLILLDPRTSSPGLGFFVWTRAVYGDNWPDYWRRLGPSILTIADGWSSGYGLYTKGEAPLVLSYTTSPGYHLEYEDTDRYRAAIFAEGHPIQIEVAGLLAAAKNKANAKKFLDFMLSDSFQTVGPHINWMYPVTPVPLPESYRVNPKSDKPLRPDPASEAELNRWAELLSAR